MTIELHVWDIGTEIVVTVTDADTGVAINISAATTKILMFRRPDRSILRKDAAFTTDGSDGKLSYVCVIDDLDQAGEWKVQAYVELAGAEWYSSIEDFDVLENLAVAEV